ncbi:MAG: hypothetical protein L6V91_00235 [Bacilli bacterium]|nr:MAG: hypothetical protein L6V91_00235 [Bacilli bacterium]
MSLRALLEEYYAEQGYDTNVVNNFFIMMKQIILLNFSLKITKILNIDNFFTQKYRLGGITLAKKIKMI